MSSNRAGTRRSPIRERTAEKQRVEKLLEGAQIKLCSVASNIFGVSAGRCSPRCWPASATPKILAWMAHSRMRTAPEGERTDPAGVRRSLPAPASTYLPKRRVCRVAVVVLCPGWDAPLMT